MRIAILAALFLVILPMGNHARAERVFPDIERFGVNVIGSASPYDFGRMNVHWYMNWQYSASPPHPGGAEYYQSLRVLQGEYWPPDWGSVIAAAEGAPGSSWFIGNEPDHQGQDNCTPAQYASRYLEAWEHIKGADHTAKLGAGGIVQASPIRLMYLDLVLDAMETMTTTAPTELIDFWHIHEQILCETCPWGASHPPGLGAQQYLMGCAYKSSDAADPEVYKGHIRGWVEGTPGEPGLNRCPAAPGQHMEGMRHFMKRNGFRNTPLVISEYGVLQPSDCSYVGNTYEQGNELVKQFMWETFDFNLGVGDDPGTDPALGMWDDENRLVQRWAWYSANQRMSAPDCSFLNSANGSLFHWKYPSIVTQFGDHFMLYTDALKTPSYVWDIEAEQPDGVGVAPLRVGTDTSASGCLYVYAPNDDPRGALVHRLSVPQTGDYYLWTRAKGLSWDENSYFVSFDWGPGYLDKVLKFGGLWRFGWHAFDGNPVSLNAGKHILAILTDEPGVRIDRIFLSNSSTYTPWGNDECVISSAAPVTAQGRPDRSMVDGASQGPGRARW